MLGSNLCDYSDTYIVVKETVTVEGDNNAKKRNKKITFKNNHVCKKSIAHLKTMYKILILLCQFIIWWNIVTTVLWLV